MIVLEVCGRRSIKLSLGLLKDLISSGLVYASPNPEQGMLDIQAFSSINDNSVNM